MASPMLRLVNHCQQQLKVQRKGRIATPMLRLVNHRQRFKVQRKGRIATPILRLVNHRQQRFKVQRKGRIATPMPRLVKHRQQRFKMQRKGRIATPMLRLVNHPQQQFSCPPQRGRPPQRSCSYLHSLLHNPQIPYEIVVVGSTFGLLSAASNSNLFSLLPRNIYMSLAHDLSCKCSY
jgi:hypothetical protein